jgi:hypothetical protein
MSAPTEMELRRPEPEPEPSWACRTPGCTEPVPVDVEDQPHCETCHAPVCAKHAVLRNRYHLCRKCHEKETAAMRRISNEMGNLAVLLWAKYGPTAAQMFNQASKLELSDVELACERWLREIRELS